MSTNAQPAALTEEDWKELNSWREHAQQTKITGKVSLPSRLFLKLLDGAQRDDSALLRSVEVWKDTAQAFEQQWKEAKRTIAAHGIGKDQA